MASKKDLKIKNPAARGTAGGIAARLGARLLGPEFGPAAGTIAVGYQQDDPWLQEMGGYQLGTRLGGRLPFVGDEALTAGGNLPARGWL